MGPRFFKRGDATRLRQRQGEEKASMGPRFFKRGDCGRWLIIESGRRSLQWGHASLSVETTPRPAIREPPPKLQWGHASLSVETTPRPAIREPPPKLQWGHASLSVETSPQTGFQGPGRWLQWGHASLSVETRTSIGWKSVYRPATRGPRFFTRGDGGPQNTTHYGNRASMGPRFFKRGDRSGTNGRRVALISLQWGHASLSVETRSSIPAAIPVAGCFNGATLL